MNQRYILVYTDAKDNNRYFREFVTNLDPWKYFWDNYAEEDYRQVEISVFTPHRKVH